MKQNCTFIEIKSGNRLEVGQTLWNVNKDVRFDVKSDGNAVLTRTCDNTTIWETSTASDDDFSASIEMQTDGNLVLLQSDGAIRWKSDTVGEPFAGASLRVVNGGSLCLFRHGSCLWQSGGVELCRPHPTLVFKRATGKKRSITNRRVN